jgi:hypothetical protein
VTINELIAELEKLRDQLDGKTPAIIRFADIAFDVSKVESWKLDYPEGAVVAAIVVDTVRGEPKI